MLSTVNEISQFDGQADRPTSLQSDRQIDIHIKCQKKIDHDFMKIKARLECGKKVTDRATDKQTDRHIVQILSNSL